MNMVKAAARAVLGPGHYDEIDVARHLLPRHQGLMVDVGAHWGSAHAVLADRGWRVIALEPDPTNRARLEATKEPSVTIDPRAVSSVDGETLTLYTSEVSSGISTLTPFHDSHRASTQVETVRLDTLLCEVASVDFLKVDTEGHDLLVLQTFPWERLTPAAVVCEFEDRKTVPLGYTYRDLGDFLMDQGYTVLLSEWHPIAEYGTRHRWRRIIDYPADLADEHGWGNFIATRPETYSHAKRVARRLAIQLAARQAVERMLRRT